MQQKPIALVLGGVLLAVLLFLGAATLLPHSKNAVRADSVGVIAPAPPKPDRSKAIHPTPDKIGIRYITPPAAGKTLTDGAIQSFVEHHPFLGGDTTTGGNPHLVKVEHMTPPDFKKRRGVKPQLPDTEQLAYVTISGPFKLNRLEAPSKEKAVMANQTATYAYLLIDIQTGNLQGLFL